MCHAPVAFVNVRGKDGEYLVKGRRVTAFANSEEEAVGLTAVVPFLLEDRLQERGGVYSKGADWGPLGPSGRQACDRAKSRLLRPSGGRVAEAAPREIMLLLWPGQVILIEGRTEKVDDSNRQ